MRRPGAENLGQLAGENIVALCDVDDHRAAAAFEKFPKARRFRDFRKLLDAVHGAIDAVVVTTPDHMHATISLAAMSLGKHVYCEKPLTWSIEEARRMARTARENRLATQMGTQGMAEPGARAGIEAIRSGVLGEVTDLHVWTDRAKGWWPQGVDRPRETPPVPRGARLEPLARRGPCAAVSPGVLPVRLAPLEDFGTGSVGDMGIHNAAMPFAALELGPPETAELVASSGLNPETFPAWSRMRLTFPPRDGRGPVTLHWYDGGQKPSADLIGGGKVADNGAIVVGTKGTLYSIEWTGGDWHLLPGEKFRDWKARPSQPRAPARAITRNGSQPAAAARPPSAGSTASRRS